MITILKNTLICYLALIGLSTVGALFICLDDGYKEQCPAQVTQLIAQLSLIPEVNEVRLMLIPVIKQLPPNWISVLIWSAIMMATAFIISISYVVAKYTYSLLIQLIKLVLIILLISVAVALYFNYETLSTNYQQWSKYMQILNQ